MGLHTDPAGRRPDIWAGRDSNALGASLVSACVGATGMAASGRQEEDRRWL